MLSKFGFALKSWKEMVNAADEEREEEIRHFYADGGAFSFGRMNESGFVSRLFGKGAIMKTGDIILIPFPFAESTNRKVRPAVIVCETKDKYQDLVICAVSLVLPTSLSES